VLVCHGALDSILPSSQHSRLFQGDMYLGRTHRVHIYGHPDCSKFGGLEMAYVSYIEGNVPSLGLDHFVHTHILRKEPDYSISMLFAGGSKALRLPDPTLSLYSFHQLTL
jgi:hypothetical protein